MVLLLPVLQVRQHTAAVGALGMLSLGPGFAVVGHIACAALEWKEGQGQMQQELRPSFAAAVQLEEQGPLERDAFEAAVVVVEFALF